MFPNLPDDMLFKLDNENYSRYPVYSQSSCMCDSQRACIACRSELILTTHKLYTHLRVYTKADLSSAAQGSGHRKTLMDNDITVFICRLRLAWV